MKLRVGTFLMAVAAMLTLSFTACSGDMEESGIDIDNGKYGNDEKPANDEICCSFNLLNEKGEVQRWTTGGAETMAILSQTKMPQEAWTFLKWWSSAEVQSSFGNLLQSTYGSEYIWPTANREAFETLPLKSAHKKTILDQMEWMTEAPWVLGTYMLERELSNAFISVAVDGTDARRALDTAVKRINRETYRKLEEFGYWKDGVMLKEFPTPDATVVQKLIDEYNQKKEAAK